MMPKENPSDEIAARYIYRKDQIFAGTNMVKPAALVPFKHVEASVTLHEGRSEKDVWENGLQTARQRNLSLVARADIAVSRVRECPPMNVVRDPIQHAECPENDNPHHAEIVGWAAEKAAQKDAAIRILSGIKAIYHPSPITRNQEPETRNSKPETS